MVKMLINLGKWLEKRFPERVVVSNADYQALISRVSNLEQHSVHKDAVKSLVLKVKDIQDEFATVKTGLGLNNPKALEIQALLNGEVLGQEIE